MDPNTQTLRTIHKDHTYHRQYFEELDSKTTTQLKRKKTSRAPIEKVAHSIRYDGMRDHKRIKSDERKLCKKEQCNFKSYLMCSKCKVHLCGKLRNCFDKFHDLHG